MDDVNDTCCIFCSIKLIEPFIKCADCVNVYICLSCFSRGKESENHSSDHAYEIIRYNFPLFENVWTASEEMKLLDGIAEFGLGNWLDVSRVIKTKTDVECKDHYFQICMNGPISSPVTRGSCVESFIQPFPIAYEVSEDPPRPSLSNNTPSDLLSVGYMPARGDFSIEYDNFAEMEISHLQFTNDEDEISRELKFAMLDMYRMRLKERKRRHRILRNHGLINIYKHFTSWYQYESTIGRSNIHHLAPFSQLFSSAVKFETFLEGIHVEKDLIKKLTWLKECRRDGITKLHNIQLYKRLKDSRLEFKPKRNMLDTMLNSLKNNKDNSISIDNVALARNTAPRRQSNPLDINGLPGYDNLADKEKQLCSITRLVPEAFMEFKTILMNEYHKNGSLRLAQARTLIKIDVNKTRKIYDYLINEGLVQK